MNRNYIIFFWILCLILFTFYCVFRLKYLSDNAHINTKRVIKEKYFDPTLEIPSQGRLPYTGTVTVTKPEITTAPRITEVSDFIVYVQNIQDKDKITDMNNCDTLYDDNFKVRELGYKNCGSAYADYLDKNYDVNTKYGNKYTLAEICPIASKTPEYEHCLQLLLSKFTEGVNLVDNVNKDLTNSINMRLNTRTEALYDIQASINPFLYSKVQNDFDNNMLMKKQVGIRTDDKLNLINKYYQDRYQVGMETFTNFTPNEIEKLFFGKYKPVNGQFYNLANLVFTIEYDDSGNNIKPSINTNIIDTSQGLTSQPTTLSQLSAQSVKANSRPVMFTFSNNDIYITYRVSNIDFYNSNQNIIKLILIDKNIVYQSSPTNIVEPLLKQLGLYAPSSINIVFVPYTSSENKKHDTYKLVNDNLDTILVLEKLSKPKKKNYSKPISL